MSPAEIRTIEDLARFQTEFAAEVERMFFGLLALLVAGFFVIGCALQVVVEKLLRSQDKARERQETVV